MSAAEPRTVAAPAVSEAACGDESERQPVKRLSTRSGGAPRARKRGDSRWRTGTGNEDDGCPARILQANAQLPF